MRRNLIATIGCLFLLGWTSLLAAQPTLAQSNAQAEPTGKPMNPAAGHADWPSFLGPNRDGKSTETGILTDWTDGRLKSNWQLSSGEGYAIGVVADGRYFHFDRFQNQARLRCVDFATGKQIWNRSK